MGNHEHSIMCSLLCYIKVPGTQHCTESRNTWNGADQQEQQQES